MAKKHLALVPEGHRNKLKTRQVTWKNPGGNSGVKIRQSLFGDARLRPKNPFGMCEPDTGYAGVGPRF